MYTVYGGGIEKLTLLQASSPSHDIVAMTLVDDGHAMVTPVVHEQNSESDVLNE